jgi:hypothetical protein
LYQWKCGDYLLGISDQQNQDLVIAEEVLNPVLIPLMRVENIPIAGSTQQLIPLAGEFVEFTFVSNDIYSHYPSSDLSRGGPLNTPGAIRAPKCLQPKRIGSVAVLRSENAGGGNHRLASIG